MSSMDDIEPPSGSKKGSKKGKKKRGEWYESAASKHVQKLIKDKIISSEHGVKGELKPKEIFDKFCLKDDSFKDYRDYSKLSFHDKLKQIRKDLAGTKVKLGKREQKHIERLIRELKIPLDHGQKDGPTPKEIYEKFCKSHPSFNKFLNVGYGDLQFPYYLKKVRTDISDCKPENMSISALKHVIELLKNGTIPLDAEDDQDPKQIYEEFCKDHPSFVDMGLEYKEINFVSQLKMIRQQLSFKLHQKTLDEEALAHDRLIYPITTHDGHGVPRWSGSEAQKLLRKHIDEELYPKETPKSLWETYEEYGRFPLRVFRDHIYSEIKSRKWRVQYCPKDYYAEVEQRDDTCSVSDENNDLG